MARKDREEREQEEEEKLFDGPSSIGELYREIAVVKDEFKNEERTLVRRKQHPFVTFCNPIHAMAPSLGKGEALSEQNKKAVEFLGWELNGEELGAAYKFVLIVSFLAAIVIAGIIFLSPAIVVVNLFVGGATFLTPIYILLPLLGMVVFATYYVQNYPLEEARAEQVRALTYVPEILGYMVMSMKLSPNLEKSIEFAAEHGRGKIAEDFKKLLWDVQLGVYSSVAEASDALAYRWGAFSDEFKKALMRIRASVIETTEAKRFALLDQTMDEILESIKNKMEQYARDLNQPTMILFYVGVLLPLILIIILPVGSSFSGAPLANPIVLFAIYNIIIPLVTLWFAFSVISKRPPTYVAPEIKDNFPGLPPKGTMRLGNGFVSIFFVVVVVLIAGSSISFFVSQQGVPPKILYDALGLEEGTPQLLALDKQRTEVLSKAGYQLKYFDIPTGVLYNELIAQGFPVEEAEKRVKSEEQAFFTKPANDITPYNFIFGLLITVSLSVFVYLYYNNIYKRKAQLEIVEMESEFKDSIYILASRMGENKPVEEALKHTMDFLPQFKISKRIFSKTLDNIALLAMPLEQAFFDPNYGSLKNIPSSLISGSVRLLVDSVQLGVNVAARTMIALSIQLDNAEKVANNLKILVSDVTGMMKTMSLFIAPMVLGITTSLQKIVIITLSSIASSNIATELDLSNLDVPGGAGIPNTFSGINVGSFIDPAAVAGMATPTQFVIIVAIYVVELLLIMTYFTTKIEEDNDLLVRINIARFFPISVIIFVLSIIISNILVGGFLA